MIEKKPKKCDGIGKAYGFAGCQKLTLYREHGLCTSCKVDWWYNDERGKIDLAKQKIDKAKTNWKEQKKVLKKNTEKLSDLEAAAKKSFQLWVRLRDAGKPCKSCKNPNPADWCGSHFFAAGIYSGLIFDERNCHGACNTYCNKYLSGNLTNYRINLVEEFGEEWMKQLEADALRLKQYKWTREELINKKQEYDNKIKELKKCA